MGLTDFEQSIYSRMKPLSSFGVAIAPQMPIRVRESNKFFPKPRSFRSSFLCTHGDRYAVIAARTDFSAEWLIQLELLSIFNPEILKNLIIICPAELKPSPAIAQLTVLPENAIALHLVEKLTR